MTMLSISPRTYFAHWQSGHRSFAVDALMALTLVLVMFAMIALIALLGSAEPGTAAANAADGAGMLILPP